MKLCFLSLTLFLPLSPLNPFKLFIVIEYSDCYYPSPYLGQQKHRTEHHLQTNISVMIIGGDRSLF